MRNRYHLLLLTGIMMLVLGGTRIQNSYGQEIIIEDRFTGTGNFTDLSTKFLWGNNTEPRSGFVMGKIADESGVEFQAISISQQALEFPGYTQGTMQASLAIDYKFRRIIHRKDSIIILEFDAFWEAYNDPWGESGRLVFTLLHDYPEQEIAFNTIYNLDAHAPFGRPGYNLRIRNTGLTGQYSSGAFLLYGGGHSIDGEIEIYKGSEPNYWLPGFSSEAGGGSPGLLAHYPLSPTQKNEHFTVALVKKWRHYTLKVFPERLEFYLREHGEQEDMNRMVFFMETPNNDKTESEKIIQINEAHASNISSLPTLYNWFGKFDALRVYFRGAEQAHLANLTLKTGPMNPAEPLVTEISNEASKERFTVYPNPNHGQFIIHTLTDEAPLQRITLIDQYGRLVFDQPVANTGIVNIDVPLQLRGCFTLLLHTPKTVHSQLVIIE